MVVQIVDSKRETMEGVHLGTVLPNREVSNVIRMHGTRPIPVSVMIIVTNTVVFPAEIPNVGDLVPILIR